MPIERPDSISLGMPAAKALQMATAAMRRRYVLSEIIEYPVVRAMPALGAVHSVERPATA